MDRSFIHNPDSEVLIIGEEEEGLRIDVLLRQRYPHHSRTYFQTLIEDGFVLLNGHPIKKRVVPIEGDEIEVCFQLTPELSLAPESIPLDILYEDEHLIAVNKPVGLVVHPAPGHWSGTFVNALLGHCENLPLSDHLRPGIVHRLDKQTSGVLIAAKTTRAHQLLIEQFSQREIEKVYLAICIGRPANGTVSAPIGRHPVHRKEMTVLPDGKEAITDIKVLAFHQNLSLVLAKPKTGRTHQIRVHLKHLGAPVLGDEIYGSSRANETLQAHRQLLHAYQLRLRHPISGASLQFTAPLPADFKHFLQQLCGSSLCQSELGSNV
ncbi:MAG: RluA family pseudouridine synthase [Verrucomicrobiota bacterium]|nr:RluA family pseudouridine synthase [Verrucomicrobiota bacterium]